MLPDSLPQATPYDPAEDPPASVDPVGTVAGAEQLADVLFSGMTARMWRARHLTFTALAAFVSEQAANAADGDEELRLEARLALERLFVSAIARQESRDAEWRRRQDGSRVSVLRDVRYHRETSGWASRLF